MVSMLLFLIIALLVLFFVLSKSTDILVTGIKQLASGTSFEAFGLTTFLVALATSLPELFVGITAALEGEQTLSVGVVMGSNIANVSLVVGVAAVISGALKIRNNIYKKDVLYGFLISSLPLLLFLDKRLSRVDGLVLLVVYVVFVMTTMTKKRKRRLEEMGEEYYEDASLTHKVLAALGQKDTEQGLARLVLGSAALIVCADLIVRLSEEIASLIGIPLILVGLFMVSIGAVLPELTFEIKAIRRREYMMVLGNLVGSVVANSSLILGAVALLNPIQLTRDPEVYYISVIAFVVIFATFWAFIYSKKELARWEGAVLVLLFFIFAAIQISVV